MRPVELRLHNFRSYVGPETVISFRDRRLVGIVGPIGSGKSSILDGISYALFGRTPTVARSTKSLINQRADDGGVQLRFEVDGVFWEVARRIRRRGQAQHALYRLDADVDEPQRVEKINGEAEVNGRVVGLIGLEFDAFNRSVLLAQGRFAEFLRAPPRERDSVLKGVFGHDRIDAMREVAKERARVAEADAEKVAFQVAQLEAKSTRLVAARSELVSWEQQVAAFEKAETELAGLEDQQAQAAAALGEATRRRAVLDAVSEGMPDAAATEAQLASFDVTAQRRRETAAALERASEAAATVSRSAGVVDAGAERTTLDEATRLLAMLEQSKVAAKTANARHDELVAKHGESLQALEKASTDEVTAQAQLAAGREAATAAEEALVEARAALHAAEHADMAATLRGELETGQLCPVCAQEVAALPPAGEDVAVDEASKVVESAVATKRAADEASEASSQRHASTVSARELASAESVRLAREVETADQALTASREAVRASERDLAAVLGESDDFAAALEHRRRSLADVLEAETAARRALDAARVAHDEAVAADQAAQASLSGLKVAVAQLAGRLGIEAAESDEADGAGLRLELEALRAAWLEQSQAVAATMSEQQQRVDAAREKTADLLTDLEVTTSFAEELGSARARAEERRTEIARLEAELDASAGLVEERDGLVLRRDVMQRLASDLTDSRFIRFLLDEERAELAELGSEHLMRLTSGRYEFDQSGSFDIVDLTASESVRKADSLSGGETFLASLGLALALAEMVARTGGRLESFFLDEGFGSLDPEHLDLAMEGIEALASDAADRLVVVVSHVPELRHRIEDLIELDRSPTTGDTRVVRA